MTANVPAADNAYNPLFEKMKERFRVQGKYTLAEAMSKKAAHPSAFRHASRSVPTRAKKSSTHVIFRAGICLSLFAVAMSLVLFAVICGTEPVGTAPTAMQMETPLIAANEKKNAAPAPGEPIPKADDTFFTFYSALSNAQD